MAKWHKLIEYLHNSGEISLEEERLACVFGFLSPGAQHPVGISKDQMTRLRRSFALNIWFLMQNQLLHSSG